MHFFGGNGFHASQLSYNIKKFQLVCYSEGSPPNNIDKLGWNKDESNHWDQAIITGNSLKPAATSWNPESIALSEPYL